MELSGSLVALVTPFRDGKIDYVALEKLIAMHMEANTDALVPCGTTGESPTLSDEEHRNVIRTTIESAAGKIPVVAGTGSNNTACAVEMTRFAADAGAKAALVVTPYYNKPTQEGMLQHFRAVAEAADIPIILYNIPGRSGTGMTAETICRLAEIENIVALKDATGSTSMAMDILAECDITVLSGDDALILPYMSIGGKGVISVIANIFPRDIVQMTHAILDGDWLTARNIRQKLHPVCRALFAETNPIGIKTALDMMGLITCEMRLPMTPMSEANRERLREELQKIGALEEKS